MKYYDIDENLARRAHEMKSMRDYPQGSATAEYRAAVDEAAALAEERKEAVSPFYHDKLDSLLDAYARRLAQWKNAYNRNGASCPSVLVCGPANFPTRKKQAQNAREDSLWREYQEIEGLLDKIKNVGVGPVDLADPHARALLTDRLQSLQNELDNGKAMNAHYRKHKTMQGFPGLTDDRAAELDKSLHDEPLYAQGPYPDFALSSLRGKIKRTQKRLAELDEREARKEQPDGGTKFDGGELVRNLDANRLQILFDDKPDEEMRRKLKIYGFHWSPKNKVWQRQLTRNAERAARTVLNIPDAVQDAPEIPAGQLFLPLDL